MHPSELLAALASGVPVSGRVLADRMKVTRAAVWKQVEALRAQGVPVASQGKIGYALPWPVELLDAARIRSLLPDPSAIGDLEVHWELDSTSSELLRRGMNATDLSFILSETQRAGRGRRGRLWLSPPGLNLYLSCVKHFENGMTSLAGLSLAVGVCVVHTIERLGLSGAYLKWPNDVLSAHGKLAGILIELSGEYQGPCAAVIGVGLNLHLPPALRAVTGQAVSDLTELAGGTPSGRNLAAALLIHALTEGLSCFTHSGFTAFREAYAGYDWLQGKPLRLSAPRETFTGIGAGVNDRGALRVLLPDGSVRHIDSAEVSVRAII